MGERRRRGTHGLVMPTKTKDGKKMATVATTAPETPASRYPMKVAVLNTGPGVNCPMAMASRSCCWVSQRNW